MCLRDFDGERKSCVPTAALCCLCLTSFAISSRCVAEQSCSCMTFLLSAVCFLEYFVLRRRYSKGFFIVLIFMSFVNYVSIYDKFL